MLIDLGWIGLHGGYMDRIEKRGYTLSACNPLIPLVGAIGFEPTTL